MTTNRDNQRLKVYRAGRVLYNDAKIFVNLKGVNQYVEKICRSHYWKKQGGVKRIIINDGRGRRKACAYNDHEISLPVWSRQESIILHELAHCLINYNHDNSADHGTEFAKCFLGLVKRFMGVYCYTQLKVAYKENRVRYSVSKK